MSEVGRVIFGGSRFLFWSLGPISLLCGIGCLVASPFAFAARDWGATTVFVLLGVCGVAFFLALLNGRRFRWAARVVTGSIATAYLLYFAATYFVEGESLAPSGRRSGATPWNALIGFVVVGLPCLWFTVRGRFGEKAETNEAVDPTAGSTPRNSGSQSQD